MSEAHESPKTPARGGPAIRLTADVEAALSFQSYPRAATIDGVRLRPLRRHWSDNGWFAEYLRLEGGRTAAEGEEGMELRQLSLSRAAPDRINAFHIHPKVAQNELWTVVQGQLLVWLVDCRQGSSSEGIRQRVILTSEEPGQLFIPAGVAHGYRAGPDGALLLYAMDQQFDAADPNEGRLPWDHFGAQLWEEDRG